MRKRSLKISPSLPLPGFGCTLSSRWCQGSCRRAAKHKKHVIVEKPMALSLEECEAMNDAAEKNGVNLLCGHTHSFDPPIRKIREIVKSGELGKLCMINTWNYNEFMYRPRMKHELASSRGVVLNQGP